MFAVWLVFASRNYLDSFCGQFTLCIFLKVRFQRIVTVEPAPVTPCLDYMLNPDVIDFTRSDWHTVYYVMKMQT